jgi:hypothetical protein
MTQSQPFITGTAHTLPFDKLSPRDFERLCLWLVEREGYERGEHLGAAGSEQGRDIVAWRGDQLWAFQCKRVQRFGPKDALAEVEKVLGLPEGERPVGLAFLVTCDVSANTRRQVRKRCAEENIECYFWAGTEFDQKVKQHTDILEEFFRQPSSSSPDTYIGSVTGPVHTGSGDIHLYVTPSRSPAAAPSTLPPKMYARLVGRVEELDQIMASLRDPQRRPMVAIVGLGGIGKTALAREAVEQCEREALLDYAVWTSFKAEYFVGESVTKARDIGYSLDELLDAIGRQCDRMDIVHMPLDQKQAAVTYLLANSRVLVVMDNLETVPEGERLVADLFPILGRSKLLITSRHHVRHERVFTINLGGLGEDEGVMFLREEGTERGIAAVAQAPRPILVEIHRITGGAPLAMKLVVGQMSRQPVEVVLGALKEAAFEGPDYQFYRFVYRHSWDMLEMNARMALVDMSVFPPVTGGAVHDVQAVSQVEPSAFWPAMDRLVALSLVDKIGLAGQERFALHPLTQYFVRSDITGEWADR